MGRFGTGAAACRAIEMYTVEASTDESGAWAPLCQAVDRLFGYQLLPPDYGGAHILAEYRNGSGVTLDVASAFDVHL